MRRFLCFLAAVTAGLSAEARTFTVVAYNVENLMDLDGRASFEEYQPAVYTPRHVLTKVQNVARLISQFEEGKGPEVLIVCELEVDLTPSPAVETAAVLEKYRARKLPQMLVEPVPAEVANLPSEALLVKALADIGIEGYHVALGDNATAAGTQRSLEQRCAIFSRFPIRASRSHPTLDARAILEAELEVDGASLYVFANHWKSGASDPETEPTRVANATTLRQRLEEIFAKDPNADVILGGDFNSQYNHKQRYRHLKKTGINDVLGSQGNELAIRGPARDLYNLWYELPVEERGSDTYRGEWGTLMHLIISRGLYDYRGVQYVDNSFEVAKFPGLNADDKGLPVRWSSQPPAGAGFSDHFPVYAKFVTVPDGRADRYLALRRASEETATAEVKKIDYAAMDLERIASAPDAQMRVPANVGKIYRVQGRVAESERLAVEVGGETYDVWSYDAALRTKLREQFQPGETARFYGELGQYRGRWQFVVQDPSWVR